MNGLASAQAAYDSAEPESWTEAEENRIAALIGQGMTALRDTVEATIGDVLDDIWRGDDSDAIREAVTECVLEQALEVLK